MLFGSASDRQWQAAAAVPDTKLTYVTSSTVMRASTPTRRWLLWSAESKATKPLAA